MERHMTHMARLVREYQQKRNLSNVALAKAVDVTEGTIRMFYMGVQPNGRAFRGLQGERPLVIRLRDELRIPKNKINEAYLADAADLRRSEEEAWSATNAWSTHRASGLGKLAV
jgi:hypothetical protein